MFFIYIMAKSGNRAVVRDFLFSIRLEPVEKQSENAFSVLSRSSSFFTSPCGSQATTNAPRTEAQQPQAPVSSPYRYVLQVQVLVVHGVAQLPDLLLHFGDFPGTELKVTVYAGSAPTILVQLQQPDHELQTRSVQVHVQAVSAEDVHERRRAQSQVLPRQTQI